MSNQSTKTIRVILIDHLSHNVSSLSDYHKNDVILMVEAAEEFTYVKHHKKKIVFQISAMRHFAEELKEKGYKVTYIKLDDPKNTGTLKSEIVRNATKLEAQKVVITHPGEYRILKDIKSIKSHVIEIRKDDRFITTSDFFKKWAEGRKNLTMEYFYREVRKKTGLLMNGKDPEGGKWNYDKENRNPLKEKIDIPPPKKFKVDTITKEVIELVEKKFPIHFGKITPFWFAVARTQALECLDYFIKNALPFFGDYQDAMVAEEPFLFHSILSHYLNIGLLSPLEICQRAEEAYKKGKAPLNATEGFIRQIIGWREYVRGIYWHFMPKYKEMNTLSAKNKLPAFYWTGKTDMHCISQVVKMTEKEAYSHHIQRLMITGNFALLTGLDVEAVHEWYLSVYADAYEWVELPNTLGMSLFGDDGIIATKPYISSGAYINRMSNFCKNCKYNIKKRTSNDACPFNFLYWDFLMRHRAKFRDNRRMAIAYANLEKIDGNEIQEIQKSAREFIKNL